MYLHCHNCNWSQDDYWSKDYNPITFLEKNYTKQLLEDSLDRIIEYDQEITVGKECYGFNAKKSVREWIANELEQHAHKIRNMEYRTQEEFKQKNPEKICPNCKQKELDED